MDKLKKVMDSFMNEHEKSFDEFFYRHKKKLQNRSDYLELQKDKEELLNKYPAVRALFEDDNVKGFSREENKALTRLFSIQSRINTIDRKEAYKLGVKEAYIFFEDMDMLNI